MRAKKPKLDEIEKILEKIEPFTAGDYINDKYSRMWLRRKLRALAREAFWLHRDSAGKLASDAFEEKFGFNAWYGIKP